LSFEPVKKEVIITAEKKTFIKYKGLHKKVRRPLKYYFYRKISLLADASKESTAPWSSLAKLII